VVDPLEDPQIPQHLVLAIEEEEKTVKLIMAQKDPVDIPIVAAKTMVIVDPTNNIKVEEMIMQCTTVEETAEEEKMVMAVHL